MLEKYRNIRIIVCLVCLSLMINFVSCPYTVSAADDEGQTVRVGYYQRKNFQEGTSDGTPKSGYAYEYLQQIASYTGWNYEYIYGEWDDLYRKLEDGDIDLLAGVAYSDERRKQISYPDYDMLKETFYIYKNSDDSSIISGDFDSYAGKKIGTVNEQRMTSSIKKWVSENNVDVEICYYKDINDCAEDFNNGKLDGYVSADNIVSSYTGITPVEMIGKEPYYLAVSKKRDDLLEKLNKTLSVIQEQNAFYLDDLRNKYSTESSVNIFLSRQEQEWMEDHPKITVGYLNNYLPYSDTDAKGKVTGLIADVVPDIIRALPGKYRPGITYRGFENQQEMLESLKNGEVDFVFPVGGETWYAEQQEYRHSSPVVTSSMELVYGEKTDRDSIRRIAVNKDNMLQYYYTIDSFPDAEIMKYDTIEDCIRAVKRGKADGTVINALRVFQLVHSQNGLNMSPMQNTDDRCFGVAQDNNSLLQLLNHGLSILGKDYGMNHAYQYMGDLVTYTFTDFVEDHIALAAVVIILILSGIVVLVIKRYQKMRESAEKEKEQKLLLEDALNKAREASEAKTVFLRNMSHDIRTPLNGIIGIIDINNKCQDEKIIRENRQKAKTSAYHLLDLVNNVLEMSRLENEVSDGNKTEVIPDYGTASEATQESVNLKQLIKDVMDIMSVQAASAGLTLTHETEGEGQEHWPHIIGNPVHIREIFLNIVGNAVKYNKDNGSIDWRDELIPAEEGGVVYKCRISDTGIGMEKEYLEHIFEPFSQEHTDARTVYQGTGLGMPIVKTLIDRMGGTIEIESEAGKGSCVYITLPFRTTEVFRKIPEEENSGELSLEGKRILLVEDNDLNLEIAQFILEDAGAEVITARDGKQAVDTYMAKPSGTYDAILMDIMMPVMNGNEAARKIRMSGWADAGKIPIIAVTACVSEENRTASSDAGINGYITKPLDAEKLIHMLVELLRNKTDSKERTTL